MLRHWACAGLLLAPLWVLAAPVVFDDGTYKALLESEACQAPVTVRVEATSPDDFGYLNQRFQDAISQIATKAWLRCPQARELHIQAMMSPATQPVMEFPVRVAEQWRITPPQTTDPTRVAEPAATPEAAPSMEPTTAIEPGAAQRPSPPADVKEWSGRDQPVEDATLARAVGKPEHMVQALSPEEKLALMELLAAQAGSQAAWQKLVAQAQSGSRTAKLALANVLLRTKDHAPMNTPEFLQQVVQMPEGVAEQGSLAAARYLLEDLTQASDGAQLAMLPEIDVDQSHDVLQVAFAELEQTQTPDNPSGADESPSADAATAAAKTDSQTPDAGAIAADSASAPQPPTLPQNLPRGGIPPLPPGRPYDPDVGPDNPSAGSATTVID
nr:hypothetical protein [Oceanococcus sp. HetDA_MAG_MS8]